MNIKIYIDEKLSSHQLPECISRFKPIFVKSPKDIELPRNNVAEVINAGKKIIYLSKSKNQIKQSPRCKANYCPGFRKIVIASNGCPFSCEYCFLQATYRGLHPFIKIYCNIDDLINELDKDLLTNDTPILYNAGEMLDSLALNEFTRLVENLVPYFAEQKNKYLLLLSKSNQVEGLGKTAHKGKTILSWSMNCDYITDNYEHGASSLSEKIDAASRCKEWGYRVRFRFDPLIVHNNWENNYKRMVHDVLTKVKPEMITIGSLRFMPSVKGFSIKRFPSSKLFESPFEMHPDRKYRYISDQRIALYYLVISEIKNYYDDIKIGLCKENIEIWDALGLKGKNIICNCLL